MDQLEWNKLDVQRSSNEKVHLLVEVIRLDNYDEVITSFDHRDYSNRNNKIKFC